MWLFALFVAVPLIEIALFIQIGGAIGLWPTLAVVILTALLGTTLVRSQGLKAMSDLRGSFSDLRDPTEALAHGAMILFSGALLLTPGFFTDALGFALLVPPVRLAIMRYVRSRVEVRSFEMGAPPRSDRPASAQTIETEYTDLDPDMPPVDGPSGWTKDPSRD